MKNQLTYVWSNDDLIKRIHKRGTSTITLKNTKGDVYQYTFPKENIDLNLFCCDTVVLVVTKTNFKEYGQKITAYMVNPTYLKGNKVLLSYFKVDPLTIKRHGIRGKKVFYS